MRGASFFRNDLWMGDVITTVITPVAVRPIPTGMNFFTLRIALTCPCSCLPLVTGE